MFSNLRAVVEKFEITIATWSA